MESPDSLSPELRYQRMEEEAAKRGLPLPPHMQMKQYEEEASKRGILLYPTFHSFVQKMHPALLEHEYMRKQISVAQRMLDGTIRRLMVFLPTQYGKSEIWSRLLPAYYLLRHPARKVALACFHADLAWELSDDARNYYAAGGGKFREGGTKGAVKNWKTARARGASGGLRAVGIGASLLGYGFNLGIVDDPVNPAQAISTAYLRRFERWWPSTFLRGQRPRAIGGSSIALIMQRLDVADPAAWLLQREIEGIIEGWHILALDEIHSTEPYAKWDGPGGYPKTCTQEPDFRQPGEVLAPKFRAPDEVKHMQLTAGPAVCSAQRQQRPMRPSGDFWKAAFFEGRVYDTLPPDAHDGGWDIDTAYTKDEHNSGSAGIKSFRGAGKENEFRVYIEDMFLDHLEFPELIAKLKELVGPFYVEAKASGKSAVQVLKTYQIMAREVTVKGDKLARASAAQPAAAAGRVYINRLLYEKLLSGDQGLLRITAEALQANGEGLDVNDAFVQSIYRHLGLGEPKKKLKFG